MRDNDPTDNQLLTLKARLQQEYRSLFPARRGWDRGVLHLLLAFDQRSRRALGSWSPEELDPLKHNLKATLRWGTDIPASDANQAGIPINPVPTLLAASHESLERAHEYEAIFFFLFAAAKGLVGISSIHDAAIDFEPDIGRIRLNVLDILIQRDTRWKVSRTEMDLTHNEVDWHARKILPQPSGLESQMRWERALSGIRDRTVFDAYTFSGAYKLPESTTLYQTSVAELRRFWCSLRLLALVDSYGKGRLLELNDSDINHLLVVRRQHLVGTLATWSQLDVSLVNRLIGEYVYNRHEHLPDIALRPFMVYRDDLLVTSNSLLMTSDFERNFCALASRYDKKAYDSSSENVAEHIVQKVAKLFVDRGMLVATGVRIKSTLGESDIDCLVYAPREEFLFAVEIKFMIQTADYAEVINRGMHVIDSALGKQLPRYNAALTESLVPIFRGAFPKITPPSSLEFKCALILEGETGSPASEHSEYGVAPLCLVEKKCEHWRGLRDLSRWMVQRNFLPKEDREFTIHPMQIVSPGGVRVSAYTYVILPSARVTI